MDKRRALTISLIIGIIVTIIVLGHIGLQEAIATMTGATIGRIVTYAGITALIMLALVWRWHVIIKAQHGTAPSFWELCRYYIVGYAVSYITPGAKMGGEVFRVSLLSRHCSFKKASSTVFIDKTVELTASGTFFVVGAAALLLAHRTPEGASGIMIIVSALLIALITLFYYQMFTGKDLVSKLFRLTRLHRTRKGKAWEKELQAFDAYITMFYRHDKRQFITAVMISLLTWALMFIEYSIVLAILGFPEMGVLQLFLIITLIGIAYLIPIPMALGSLEAGQAGVFAIIGMNPAVGVGVALITRLKDIILSILGFTTMSYYGLRLGREAIPFRRKQS